MKLSWTHGQKPPAGGGGMETDFSGVIPIATEKRIDWNAIRADYIGGGESYRSLAEKYGTNKDVIARKAKAGHWDRDRDKVRDKATTMCIQKTAVAVADNATLAANIKRRGLEILADLFEDFASVRATEHRESKGGKTDIKRLRDLTAAYKDLTGDMVANNAADNALLQSLFDIERGFRDGH